MNLKFIERKAGYKVVKFRGVGVAYKKVVDGKLDTLTYVSHCVLSISCVL